MILVLLRRGAVHPGRSYVAAPRVLRRARRRRETDLVRWIACDRDHLLRGESEAVDQYFGHVVSFLCTGFIGRRSMAFIVLPLVFDGEVLDEIAERKGGQFGIGDAHGFIRVMA